MAEADLKSREAGNALKRGAAPLAENIMTGAEVVLQALRDNGVDTIFGYPGGAVLPIYDALHQQSEIQHILMRHEQGAAHAAEGYARSTGKPGVVLVTSGPGATNAVTGIADAMLDSIPLVVITGQVPRSLIGSDAFQECDTVGITRACSKHNYLVSDTENLAHIMHEAFYVATHGRPGPVVIDIPKDVQFEMCPYESLGPQAEHRTYHPKIDARPENIIEAVRMIASAKRPIFYTGGGVINSGPNACETLRTLVRETGFPITSTLMGLGAFPAPDPQWLGMLGMHGSYEANHAMHDCDLMICVGARFDDRITGRLDGFSPNSRKIHIDIDPSSINKNIKVDLGLIGDCGHVLEDILKVWRQEGSTPDIQEWKAQIEKWRRVNCFSYEKSDDVIKPQYAIERLYALTRSYNPYITTEVGQHQMWAAQFFHFDKPNHWMTSGGLGTMGYGLPAALGVQAAHRGSLVIDIAGEASVQMTMQEMSSAVQHRLPIKIFILNNEYMGMVRQWQELLHGGRYSHSYSDALPDFVKMAEAFGCLGLRAQSPAELDEKINEMIAYDGPVLFDCRVTKEENCFPMIPSGKAHNEMILGGANVTGNEIDTAGRKLV